MVARCLNTAHIRGMGVYVAELLKQSASRGDLDWVLFGDDSRYGMAAPNSPRIASDIFEFRGDRFYFWEQIGLPLRALKRELDLVHCTEGTLPLWQPRPTVVTVHDTLMWDEPRDSRVETAYLDRVLPAAMKKCAAIITISESSRSDILKKWPWLEARLTVIPHGIANEYFIEEHPTLPEDLQSWIGDAPYIVYLGGPMERKRFAWALNIFAHCRHASLKLIACGFGAETREKARRELPEELRGKVHFADFLSDTEIRALYKGARAVLYPTLYEGFGFPAVEAQASGVPVIFSSLGSLAELIGPLAILVPPFDLEAWLGALTEALAPGEARAGKVRAAKEWARKFSWSESFDKHVAVYRRIADAHV